MNSKNIKVTLYDYCKSDTENEWILEQFDYDKNYPHTPKDFGKSSTKRVYFKFPCGHSMPQRISDKTGKKSKKCPHCLNRGVIGKSLVQVYPLYADMFMDEKNGISANQVTPHNGKAYWWKCNICGHEFIGRVADVVSGHRVCDVCANDKISFPEYCLYFYLKKLDENCELNKKIEGYRFDVFLPKYNLIIEYDGYPWHNSEKARKNDAIKDATCKKLNIHILRIRDGRLKDNENLTAAIWNVDYDDELRFLMELPQKVGNCIGKNMLPLDINVKRDFRDISEFRTASEGKKSLLAHMPELSKFIDMDDERNGNPAFVVYQSHSIRFWLRDPEYPKLKWSLTAHRLFNKKEPYTRQILMCRKVLARYPELEGQVMRIGNDINEKSVFRLRCSCGNDFEKDYTALMEKGRVEMCGDCLLRFRLKNIGRL